MGYERYREIVLENQKKLGIVPPDTELSPVNPYLDVKGPDGEPWPLQDTVRPWDSLSDEEKRLFARMAEVFAGFLSYTDAQIGRVLDYLEESGQLDNTIIVVISDNGASGEGGPNGSVNEVKFFNGYIDTVEESMRFFDELGGPDDLQPLPDRLGDGLQHALQAVTSATPPTRAGSPTPQSSPGPTELPRTAKSGTTTSTSATSPRRSTTCWTSHRPQTVKGIDQKPLDGVSFKAALDDPDADTGKHTQFYTMLGTRGIWHDGWFANTVHAAAPVGLVALRRRTAGSCYHIETDRSQCHDLAAEQPDKLADLAGAVVRRSAAKYNGLPLADLNIFEMVDALPTLAGRAIGHGFIYYPDTAPVGDGRRASRSRGRSFSVLAEVTLDSADAEGVLLKQGAGHGGYVLFVADGRLQFVYNFLGEEEQRVSAPDPLPTGEPHPRRRLPTAPAPSRAATRRSATPPSTSTATRWPRWRG